MEEATKSGTNGQINKSKSTGFWKDCVGVWRPPHTHDVMMLYHVILTCFESSLSLHEGISQNIHTWVEWWLLKTVFCLTLLSDCIVCSPILPVKQHSRLKKGSVLFPFTNTCDARKPFPVQISPWSVTLWLCVHETMYRRCRTHLHYLVRRKNKTL